MLTFSSAVLQEAGGSHGDASVPEVLARQTIPITLPVYRDVQRVRTLALKGIRPDEIEEASLGILAFVIGAAGRPRSDGASPGSARARWDLVQAVRERLAGAPAERVALSTLATELGCSSYHLARIFKAVTGCTVHRYRTDLRIAMAVEYMHDPERSLSAIAYEIGFSSHSHLTSTFRRALDRPPREVRRIASGAGPALRRCWSE